MRRLAFIVAAVFLSGCFGTPAGSAPASPPEATPLAPGMPSPAPSAESEATPAPGQGCPTGVLSVHQLVEAPLTCYGRREVTVLGFLGEPPGMGWDPPYIEPRWLVIPRMFDGALGKNQALWQDAPGGDEMCPGSDCDHLYIYIPPTSALTVPAVGGWVVVTGHRMDPAAEQCHYVYGAESVPDPTFNDEEARQSCRQSFVVTSITKAAAPTAIPTPARETTKPPTPSPSSSDSAVACEVLRTMVAQSGSSPGWPATSVDCLGRSEVRVTGWLADTWGIGWGPSGIDPAWLGDTVAIERVLWLERRPTDGCITDTDCIWIFLHSPKAGALPLSPDRWVTVTGHFDDPAAASCIWTGPAQGYSVPLTKVEAVARCRSHFVVTAIENAAPPGPSPTP